LALPEAAIQGEIVIHCLLAVVLLCAPPCARAQTPGDPAAQDPVAKDQQTEAETKPPLPVFGETVIVEPPGASVDRVPEAVLETSPGATLTDKLAYQPGVHQAGLGGAFQAVSIGGLGKHRVRMEVGGYRLEGDRRAGTDLGTLMPSLATGAALFRGGTGLSHGSEAMGGVVDIEMPQPGAETLPWGLRAGYGTNDGRGEVVATAGGEDWLVAAGWEDAGRYEDGDGALQEGFFTRYNLYGVLKRERGRATHYYDLLYTRGQDIGKPMVTTRPTVYPENTLALAGLRGFAGPFRYQAGLIYQSLETATTGESSVINSVNLHAKGYYDRGPWTVGVEGYTRQGMDAEVRLLSGTEHPLDGASRVELAPLASWRKDWDTGWTLEAGARYNFIRAADGRGLSRDDGLPTGTLRMEKGLGAHRVRASVFNSFRFPTMEELYYDGLTARGHVEGNPDLDPETGVGAGAGWSVAFEGGSAGFDYSVQDVDDFIERYKATPTLYRFRNLGRARIRDLTAHLIWRSLSLGATWASGEDRDTGAAIDDIPPLKATFLWRGAYGPWRPHASVVWADAFDEPGPGETVREGYAVLGAGLAWDAGPGLTVSLRAENLLGETYTPSADADAVPAMGRQIIVGIALRAR
jgi:outer membrane receptor protein involved in Fe transport